MEPLMYTIAEFCNAHKISRSFFYVLISKNIAPKITKIGTRTLITAEAAQEWRKKMEDN